MTVYCLGLIILALTALHLPPVILTALRSHDSFTGKGQLYPEAGHIMSLCAKPLEDKDVTCCYATCHLKKKKKKKNSRCSLQMAGA